VTVKCRLHQQLEESVTKKSLGSLHQLKASNNKLLLGTAKSKSAGKKMMPQADGYKWECAYISMMLEAS
jgi:hypothetical protein